uniref:MFS transporter, SIT family, siderophore-iron:H+ symporter n=1 Tax=Kwoniella dejecticola CBS 10117 TaxID=1296121 RepID=A0A1A5ZW74_9TREE|nr:MFS transporter, SIT family, siderophore-iron:H+ symporter [Kwoniella dejecticola CBS 10117]OBR82065.1 MFS transporter, SIT family, siderophore-iron:H+ symporter [Kwoniella dejecticola CBS 10117]
MNKTHHTGDPPLYPDQEISKEIERQGDDHTAFGDKSPGVRRIEAIATCFTTWHKWVLFLSVFLVAYSYGLDGTVRYTYQATALSDLKTSSQLSTVTVVRSVVAAAAQPAFAKISDYFGRVSILFISVIFYAVGSIVQSTAKGLGAFAGGAVIYQFGYTGAQLLVEVLIADVTSLRSRLFFSYIPAMPFIINAWVSGNIASAVLGATTWGWGMWAIIFPAMTIPLFGSLLEAEWRASRRGLLKDIPSPLRTLTQPSLWVEIFWQIDLVGLILLAAVFGLILVPFTLAGGVSNTWKAAHIIAPLVIGFVVALPAFVIWETKIARHPAVPFRLFRDTRMVLAPICIAMLLNTAWYTQGDYLYYTLTLAFDRDITSATRVQNIYSFCSVVVGVALGLVIRRVRRLKWFIVAGTLLFVLAFGLLIRYRGGFSAHDFAGLVGAEVVLGIAGGLFPYPTQVMIQSAVQHERTATVTSLYLASYSIGSALGNTIAAAIWNNSMPKHLLNAFTRYGVSDPATIAASTFASPLALVAAYPPGTPEREAASEAYREVQRYLTITGICLSTLLVFASLCLRNPRLGDQQSLPDAEGFTVPVLPSQEKSTHNIDQAHSPTGTAGNDEHDNHIQTHAPVPEGYDPGSMEGGTSKTNKIMANKV